MPIALICGYAVAGLEDTIAATSTVAATTLTIDGRQRLTSL